MRTISSHARTAAADATLRLTVRLRTGWARLHEQAERRDAGYSTEAAIITALLAVLAIAMVAVITSKVMDKVNSMQF